MDVAIYNTCTMLLPLTAASLLAAWIPPNPRRRNDVVPTNSSTAALQSRLMLLYKPGVEEGECSLVVEDLTVEDIFCTMESSTLVQLLHFYTPVQHHSSDRRHNSVRID